MCSSDLALRLGCSMESCRFALRVLTAQQHRDALPALLPPAAVVANKPGLGWSDLGDVGVLYRDGAPLVILAVYLDAIPKTTTDGLPGVALARTNVARLARACWDALVVDR